MWAWVPGDLGVTTLQDRWGNPCPCCQYCWSRLSGTSSARCCQSGPRLIRLIRWDVTVGEFPIGLSSSMSWRRWCTAPDTSGSRHRAARIARSAGGWLKRQFEAGGHPGAGQLADRGDEVQELGPCVGAGGEVSVEVCPLEVDVSVAIRGVRWLVDADQAAGIDETVAVRCVSEASD